MINGDLSGRDFSSEFSFTASRSSGPGGQHVNKVSTKVELRFDVVNSNLLSQEEKEVILSKVTGKINAEGVLIIVSQVERSQLKNKERTIEKFYALLANALKPRKKRKPTKPSQASKEKRLEAKRLQSEKKTRRKT
ncbi:MAG: aminoacyl-tRNA hydrolase [Bacteroidales bacterium]|jgi:ribosome-associated protein|nr:aminoacyl-tRNA hydrolase [Bacteroidales bacterium]